MNNVTLPKNFEEFWDLKKANNSYKTICRVTSFDRQNNILIILNSQRVECKVLPCRTTLIYATIAYYDARGEYNTTFISSSSITCSYKLLWSHDVHRPSSCLSVSTFWFKRHLRWSYWNLARFSLARSRYSVAMETRNCFSSIFWSLTTRITAWIFWMVYY